MTSEKSTFKLGLKRDLTTSAIVFLVTLLPCLSFAGLGDVDGSIERDRVKMRASHVVVIKPQYSIHDLKTPDGSRVRQYVSLNGQVFAVTWSTQYKPDMSSLLGNSFGSYDAATQAAGSRGGIQRQMRHETQDLYVQANSHLNIFSGSAYLKSASPQGFGPNSFSLE